MSDQDAQTQFFAAYLRDSGGDAQDLSVSQQETEIQKWAAANGFIITMWFRDEARKGSSTVGREGFHEMIAHFRSSAPEQGVVIWKMSRFARDIDDSQFYKADLRRRGYRIVSLADNIPEGPEGRFFEAAIDWMNQRFLEDLSKDVKRGLRDLVEKYGAVPGTPPRGFMRSPVEIGTRRDGKPHIAHRWVPDLEWIPRVRQAFLMRLAGSSLAEITEATHLYDKENSYATFFSNPLYKGELHFGGLVIPNYCTPIVEPELWERLQEVNRRYANRTDLTHPRRISSRFLLSGLVYCAACNSPLTGIQRKGHESYYCSNARRHEGCQARPVPRKVLEAAVQKDLLEYILLPENLQAMQDQIQKSQAEQERKVEEKQAELSARLTGVRKRLANITKAIEESGSNRTLLDRMKVLDLEEAEILAAQSEMTSTQSVPQLTFEQIGERSENLRSILNSADLTLIQRILRGFIAKIVVERDGRDIRGVIFYYFPHIYTQRDPPESDIITVSLYRSPVGAHDRRYGFSHEFKTQMRPYTRRQRP